MKNFKKLINYTENYYNIDINTSKTKGPLGNWQSESN